MDNNECIRVINEINSNPHTVEKYNKIELFDLLRFGRNIYKLLKLELELGFAASQVVNDNYTKIVDVELKNRKQKAEKFLNGLNVIETFYDKIKDLPLTPPYSKTITSTSTDFNQPIPPSTEIDFDVDAALKVCFLYELGVVDVLIKKGFTNNKIADLLSFLTDKTISKGSANQALSRIRNEELMEKYKSDIGILKLKFGINE